MFQERYDKANSGVALLFALRHEFLDTFKNVNTVIVDAAGAFAAAQKDKKDQKARKVNSDYTPEGLYEVYKSLPESEKRVVKIAALVYEPFSMTKIMEIFNAGFQHLDKPLTASWAKIWLLELNQAAFLLYLPSSQYRIKSDFADYLIGKEFETDKEFRGILLRIQRIMEPTPTRFRDYEPAERYFRETRFALFMGNLEKFRECYFQTIQHAAALVKYSQKEMIKLFLPSEFNLEKLDKIPVEIRAFLLIEHLSLMANDLSKTDDYVEYAVKNIPKFSDMSRSNMARLIAQIAVYQGDWERVSPPGRAP